MTKAAAESLPAGWMRRSSSCRGGSLVEADGGGEVRPASAVAALAGRTEGIRVRAAAGAAADGREWRLPSQAGRVAEHPRESRTPADAPADSEGLDGQVGGRRIERASGSGVAQREPTGARLKGVPEQGKGPAIRHAV